MKLCVVLGDQVTWPRHYIIYLQKAFIKAPIFHHFDTEDHIYIETDPSGYATDGILIQIISDQHFFNHITYEDSDSFKSENGQ